MLWTLGPLPANLVSRLYVLGTTATARVALVRVICVSLSSSLSPSLFSPSRHPALLVFG